MSAQEELKEYIKDQFQEGKSPKEVRELLLDSGWKDKEIKPLLSEETKNHNLKLKVALVYIGVGLILVSVSSLLLFLNLDIFSFKNNKINAPNPHDKSDNALLISKPEDTKFAEYKPYSIDVVPTADSYELPVNIYLIKNISDFSLSPDLERKILGQGFAAIPTTYEQPYDLYNDNRDKGIPNFVTTDSVLHTYHVLYDFILRKLEMERFIPDLKNLNKTLLSGSVEQYYLIEDPELKEAARNNIAYFAVASKLLDPQVEVPKVVQDLVEAELALIEQQRGFLISPIFGYKEDYSQYVPRGHYTRNEEFEGYFKSMMWYGRMMFRVKPDRGVQGKTAIETGREETRQALLIVKLLNDLNAEDDRSLEVWRRIYEPTVFFVGKTDDLNIYDYLEVVDEVYEGSLSLSKIADDKNLETVISKLTALEASKISSSLVLETEEFEETTKAFRFMGQKFIPDSYILQELVWDKVEDYTGDEPMPFTAEIINTMSGSRTLRAFPRGLDVAGVLGSERAKEILDVQKDSEYEGYEDQFVELKTRFSNLPLEQWNENLYWNWLYSLRPTLEPKGEGYPVFMQQDAWLDKDLNSFLGSWTELRHDTILYAKQSYLPIEAGVPFVMEAEVKPRGYVEPNIEVYTRLASLARFTREGLDSRDLLGSVSESKLKRIEEMLLELRDISEKELTNETLSEADYDYIDNIGIKLRSIATFPEGEDYLSSEADKKMEIVADVHTDVNSSQVLEEGVGSPMDMYVVVKDGEELYISSGPIFSYFEFKQSISERLTDEMWQEMEKPPLPSFVNSFVEE